MSDEKNFNNSEQKKDDHFDNKSCENDNSTYQVQQPSFSSNNVARPQNSQYVYPPDYIANPKRDYTTLYSVLCYIPLLWIVGLLLDQNNPIVKFHINQGILLNICSVALNIIIAAITSVIVFVFPASVFITAFLSAITSVAIIIFMILGIINAVNLQNKPLPIIGSWFTFLK